MNWLTTLMTALSEYWLLVVLGLIILALLVAVILLLLLQRDSRKAAAGMTDKTETRTGNPFGRQGSAWIFARAAYRLRRSVGRTWRYTAPWVLMIGENGSGKTSLLTGVELDRTLPADEAATPQDDCSFHVFDKGIVIDVHGDLVLKPGGVEGDADRWRDLTMALQRHRPERPLDSVILVISATDLLAAGTASSGTLTARGEALHARLWDLQRQTGLRLPIHVVVSRCDCIPSFQPFWQEPPVGGFGTMLGWSNPRNLDDPYDPAWVPTAIEAVTTGLNRHYIAAAAALDRPADADALFSFPADFQTLGPPLQLVLDRIFRSTAYQEGYFLRSISFTGETAPEPVTDVRALVPLVARPPGLAAADSRPDRLARPSFVTDLLSQKIFAETRLTRIAKAGLVSRNRSVLTAQVLSLLAIISASVLLIATRENLQELVKDVQGPLELIRDDANEGVNEVMDARQTRTLLEQFSNISRSSLSYWTLPTSQLDDLEFRVSDRFRVGLENIVLRPIRSGLIREFEDILDVFGSRGSLFRRDLEFALSEAEDVQRLGDFLTKLDGHRDHAEKFNNIKTRGVADLADLVLHVTGEQLGDGFTKNSGLYARGLTRVAIEPVDIRAGMQQADPVLDTMIRRIEDRMSPNGAIMQRGIRLVAALNGLRNAEQRNDDVDDALRELISSLIDMQLMVESPYFRWIGLKTVQDDPLMAQLFAQIGSTEPFDDADATQTRDRMNGFVTALRAGLLALRGPGGNPILVERQADRTLHLHPTLDGVANVLMPVFRLPFMAAIEERLPRPAVEGEKLIWDISRMKAAVGLYRSFEEFQSRSLGQVPDAYRDVVERVARERLRQHMLATLADAQLISAVPTENFDFGESALQSEVAELRKATPWLVQLAGLFRQLRMSDADRRLREIAGGHALSMLRQLDEVVGADALYASVDGFQSWTGEGRLTSGAFAAGDDLAMAQYLDAQRSRIQHLWTEIGEPLTDLLGRDEMIGPWQGSAELLLWQRLATELQRYRAGSPISTLAGLEKFLRFDLNGVTLENCREKLAAGAGSDSGDYFLGRQQALMREVLDQCQWLRSNAIRTDYDRLAADFTSRLAGRYPFGPLPNPGQAEADPQEVAAFFRRFAAAEAKLQRSLSDGTADNVALTSASGPKAAAGAAAPDGKARRTAAAAAESTPGRAAAFVAQLSAVRAFLAPFLVPSGDPSGGVVSIQAEFRVNREREFGGNQIIDWLIDSGQRQIRRTADGNTLSWRPGDPFAIALRWAKDGPVEPIARQGGFSVSDRTAIFSYSGPWALVRVLQTLKPKAADLPAGAESQPHLLRLAVPTARSGAPAPDAELAEQTVVFLRLILTSAGAAGEPPRIHQLPTFPVVAPAFDAEAGP
jgi:type VI secretion system protein ImpL